MLWYVFQCLSKSLAMINESKLFPQCISFLPSMVLGLSKAQVLGKVGSNSADLKLKPGFRSRTSFQCHGFGSESVK